MWDHLARDPLRGLVVAQERSGTLGGGPDVVAVRGEVAPAPQAHRTAPYRCGCAVAVLPACPNPRPGFYVAQVRSGE